MAKKKSKKRKGSRRRRIGAAGLNPRSPLVMAAGAAAGFFLGDKINEHIETATNGKVDGKIIGGAEAGLGAFLLLRKKKTMLTSLGGGFLAGMGAKKLAKELGIINGVGGFRTVPVLGGFRDVPVIGARRMAGYIPSSGRMGGYTVPRTASNVMGSAESGSGLMNASGYMN